MSEAVALAAFVAALAWASSMSLSLLTDDPRIWATEFMILRSKSSIARLFTVNSNARSAMAAFASAPAIASASFGVPERDEAMAS